MSSLPSRERGLKFSPPSGFFGEQMSLPSRERGLKSAQDTHFVYTKCVAPFAGAWIEIVNDKIYETTVESLPSRERGLKYRRTRFRSGSDQSRSLRGSVD